MTTDFSLITHAAQRHTHKFTPRSLGNRLAQRGFADTRRADKAENRP